MNVENMLAQIDEKAFTRQELLFYVQKEDSAFPETRFRRFLGALLENNKIVRIGRNLYEVSDGSHYEYLNRYSDIAKMAAEIMDKRFPLLDFRIWELCWLNEFFNHQIARNKIFVEVENDGCEYAFSALEDKFESVLLKPSGEELVRYGKDDGIIIDRLVGEAPRGGKERYNVPLEKIIVDLFANKLLKGMVSQGDYPGALSEMFKKYKIDQSKLFRYARRRNKEEYIREYLAGHTDIRLI